MSLLKVENLSKKSIWLICILIILVSFFIMVLINLQAHHNKNLHYTLLAVDALTHEIEAIEWKAIAQAKISENEQKALLETRIRLLNDVDKLISYDHTNTDIAILKDKLLYYNLLVDRELRLIDQGKIAEARLLDEELVDPQLEKLKNHVNNLLTKEDSQSANLRIFSLFAVLFLNIISVILIVSLSTRWEKAKQADQIARLESLNIIGETAASIAHEIRNPMTTVRGFLQIFQHQKQLPDPEHLKLMIEELDRANSIITEFLALAKNRAIEIKTLELNKIILNIYPLIRADAISSEKDILLDLKPINMLPLDEKEIRQLILNLVRNSLEAMDKGGIVTIGTFEDENHVILYVQDTGKGMPNEILKNIGTPFMTTKENGTGLGLAVCSNIAHHHHAKVEFKSSSQGTTVLVKFVKP